MHLLSDEEHGVHHLTKTKKKLKGIFFIIGTKKSTVLMVHFRHSTNYK